MKQVTLLVGDMGGAAQVAKMKDGRLLCSFRHLPPSLVLLQVDNQGSDDKDDNEDDDPSLPIKFKMNNILIVKFLSYLTSHIYFMLFL